jgi:hypothetical protein
MIARAMVAAYRANPFRPHCRAGGHVRLCRLVMPRLGAWAPQEYSGPCWNSWDDY